MNLASDLHYNNGVMNSEIDDLIQIMSFWDENESEEEKNKIYKKIIIFYYDYLDKFSDYLISTYSDKNIENTMGDSEISFKCENYYLVHEKYFNKLRKYLGIIN
jgi:hypothetical protein